MSPSSKKPHNIQKKSQPAKGAAKAKPKEDDGKIRINKWISDSGHCSRRKADELIEAGRVRVNGKRAVSGQKVDNDKDTVTVDGEKLFVAKRKAYIVLHKSQGTVSTHSDEKSRKTIYDDLPEKWHRLAFAGRLDKETSGVLILSDDGDFIHRLMHPSFHVSKTYRITLDRPITETVIKKLKQGVFFEEEQKTAKAEALSVIDPATIEMVLITGLNRQVRRMLMLVGYKVKRLKRVAYGDIRLKKLAPGQWRFLTKEEQRNLLKKKF